MRDCFVEIDHFQVSKRCQNAEGDTFLSRKTGPEGRIVSVLSDGLGSGIKAGVLSTLTASMALSCIERDVPAERTAEVIMRTLPICRERKISYSTFTIVDVSGSGETRIIEYDNPPCILIRDGRSEELQRRQIPVRRSRDREQQIVSSRFEARAGDRLVFFSDGVTQSGIGTGAFPLGWGSDGVSRFVLEQVERDGGLSARELARRVVQRSLRNDAIGARDDITCGVIYFRQPRRLLVVSGPPLSPERDREMAHLVRDFAGGTVISGGTTANIVARELGRSIRVPLNGLDPQVPPCSEMDGIDLVTEGIITMAKVADELERGSRPEQLRRNAVSLLMSQLLESDVISFVVGSKINEAHQDPAMPVELEIRRNVVKKVAFLLERKYLKEVHLRFM